MSGNFFGNFRKRDFFVILIAIVALAGLFVVIRMTRQQDSIDQKELVQESSGESSQESTGKITSYSYDEKVLINEISSDGVIEFYNVSLRAMDISGYKVFVGTELATTVPDGSTLNPNDFFVVETKKSLSNNKNNLVKIYNQKDNLVKALSFDAIPSGMSYGCVTDGSYEAGMITSSIGESNNGSTREDNETLVFSVPGGFYSESFELELSAPEGYKIYYTTDGREATTDSTEYSSKITVARPSGSSYTYAVSDGNGYTYASYFPENVDMGTVVNAIAVDSKGKVADSKTVAYYIGYDTDTDYVGLPVISLELSPEEMFSFESGIFVPGKSYYDGYIQGDAYRGNFLNKNSAHGQLEYYEATKDRTYTSDVSVSIFDDGRRYADQKSFLVTAAGEEPQGTSLSDYYTNGSGSFVLLSGGWDSGTKVRSSLVNTLAEGTNIITRDYSPCVVFINGEYWGLYLLSNEYNTKYFQNKYGIKDNMIVIADDYNSSAAYTQFYEYVVNTDFSIDENYQIVNTMMDVSNYIEFMCTNILIGNTKMYTNLSSCVFKTVNNTGTGYSDGKWRWALNNVDCSMGNSNSYISDHTVGDYSRAIMNTYLSQGIRENALFNSLLQNESFREEYLKTMDDLISNYFTAERANSALDAISANISKAVYSSNSRYAKVDSKQFENNTEKIRTFFEGREYYLRLYTNEYISKRGHVEDTAAVSESSEEANMNETEANAQEN